MARNLFLILTVAAMTVSLSGAAQAQKLKPPVVQPTPKVTKIDMAASSGTSLLASGQNVYAAFSDHPASVNFKGTVSVSLPTNITYRWERSDGTTGATQTLHIAGGNAQINDTWTNLCSLKTGAEPASYQTWETLHVLSPTDLRSTQFKVGCVEIAHAKVGAYVTGAQNNGTSHPVYNGSCPATIGFGGPIQATGPFAVTYHWERSDGTKTASTQGQATQVGTEWQVQLSDSFSSTGPIGAAYTVYDNVHITMPFDVTIASFSKVGMTCTALKARQ